MKTGDDKSAYNIVNGKWWLLNKLLLLNIIFMRGNILLIPSNVGKNGRKSRAEKARPHFH